MIDCPGMWYPDPAALASRGRDAQTAYRNAKPFPHAVFDDLFPSDFLDRVSEDFPKPGDVAWNRHYHANSRKVICYDQASMGPWARSMFSLLNHQFFVGFLEQLTGIEGLIPDPHLHGGGLHQTGRGGRLEVHADFNRHSRLRLDRRLNVIVFLNRDWKEEYGGYLELWDRDMTRCEVSVAPAFNRTIVFNTTDHSFHGHPHPLACPKSRARRSLAVYYYSNGRPDEEVSDDHSTLYQMRPGQLVPQKPRRLSARIRKLFRR